MTGAPVATPLALALRQALPAMAGGRCCPAATLGLARPPRSSLRRRIWELDGLAHCPVVGLCLPLAQARRLAVPLLGDAAPADDYDFHCRVVIECKRRSPVAEAVHKALDARHAAAVRAAAACKSEPELRAWWRQAGAGCGIASALWALLTHPDCGDTLALQVLGEVHMRQHEVGHAQRAETARAQALEQHNAALRAELAAARERRLRQVAEHAAECRAAQAAQARLHEQLLARDATIARLEQDGAARAQAAADLPQRQRLQALLAQAREELAQAQRELGRVHESVPEAAPAPAATDAAAACALPPDPTLHLQARTVLCVGGRTAAVPAYRELLTRLGARFEHHDGGQQQNVQRLQASLAAADLVVCQAGCISHGAYWRVKSHCKRTGKRCVFVESTGTGALERALREALAEQPEETAR